MSKRNKELAEQAGFFPEINYDRTKWHAAGFDKNFERFANLVRQDEREKCAKLFDAGVWFYDNREIAAAIRGRTE